MRVYKRKGSDSWYADGYTKDGKRLRFSCETRDKRQALSYARVQFRRSVERLSDTSVKQAVERFLDDRRDQYRPSAYERMAGSLRLFSRAFGARPVEAITPGDIEGWLRSQRRKLSWSPRTSNLHRANVRRLYAALERLGVVDSNPVDRVDTLRCDRFIPHLLSIEEYGRLRAAIRPQELRLWLTLAWETGARLGELLDLKWGDVAVEAGAHATNGSGAVSSAGVERSILERSNLGSLALPAFQDTSVTGTATFRVTKTRKGRTIPMSREALAPLSAIQSLCTPSREAFVISRPSGTRNLRQWIYGAFKRAAKRAGVPNVRPHDLRHSAASRWLAAGHSPVAVARMLGHSSPQTTLRVYAHCSDEQLRSLVVERSP